MTVEVICDEFELSSAEEERGFVVKYLEERLEGLPTGKGTGAMAMAYLLRRCIREIKEGAHAPEVPPSTLGYWASVKPS